MVESTYLTVQGTYVPLVSRDLAVCSKRLRVLALAEAKPDPYRKTKILPRRLNGHEVADIVR
jgi:hypothetical protein